MRTRALSLIALAHIALASAAEARTVSYAVVIGNNAAPREAREEHLKVLRYADDDAARYYQLFSQFTSEVTLLTVLDDTSQRRYPSLASRAEPPTLRALRATMTHYAELMQRDRNRGDLPVFYLAFSGHGATAKDGTPFLALLDGELTQTTIYDELLAKLPAAYSHLIVDACQAGSIVGVRGEGFFGNEVDAATTALSAEEMGPVLDGSALARHPNVGVIIATSETQAAHEWSEIESGVFTHELVSALTGAADINGDGRVEYSEAQAFIASANRDIEDRRALPRVIARAPKLNKNAPLVSLSAFRDADFLSGTPKGLGHFYVELATGQRYLEAHLSGSYPVTLALPRGIVAYLRSETAEAELPATRTSTLYFDDVVFTRPKTAARGSIDASFRRGMFASDFGPTYYKGFVDSTGIVGVQTPLSAPDLSIDDSRGARRQKLAIGAALVSGAAAVSAIVTGAIAIASYNQWNDTDIQKSASDASDRYQATGTAAIITGSIALAAGATAPILRPKHKPVATPSAALLPASNGTWSVSTGLSVNF